MGTEAFKKSATNGKGVFSNDKNPLPVPMKGSELPMRNRSGNEDRSKVDKQVREQAKNESLRGEAG